MGLMGLMRLKASVCVGISLAIGIGEPTLSLPPPEDLPEEILRTEIITTARSPVDGKPLSAAEYVQLQEKLATEPPPRISSDIRHLIFLLRVRKLIRTILPF